MTVAFDTNKTPPLIVFDLVATLTDAGPRYAQAYIRACEAWGQMPPSKASVLDALGNKNLKQIIAEFTPTLPPESVDDFMRECNGACDALLYDVAWHEDLYPNVRRTLKTLREQGYVLGIYTGTREDVLDNQLRYHNIAACFDSRFLRAKNNERDGFMNSDALKAAQLKNILESYTAAFGLDAATARVQTIVVGDSAADWQAARREGLRFIGFSAKDALKGPFTQAGKSVAVFTDFKDLPMLLNRPAVREYSYAGYKPA